MIAGMSTYLEISVALLLSNFGKLAWRVTAVFRTRIIQRMFIAIFPFVKDDQKDLDEDTAKEVKTALNYLASIETLTDHILENAASLFAPVLMMQFYAFRDFFFLNFSETSSIGGWGRVFTILAMSIPTSMISDITFLMYSGYYQQLPHRQVYRDLWAKRFRYFGFLIYGMLSMGLYAQV